MTESWESSEALELIEAAVREAGGFVQVSDDLRPRVLETSRLVRGEQRARCRIGKMACIAFVLALFISVAGDRMLVSATHASNPLLMDADGVFSLAEAKSVRGDVDFTWGMVEAFTDLRRRQANSFRPAG